MQVSDKIHWRIVNELNLMALLTGAHLASLDFWGLNIDPSINSAGFCRCIVV